MLKDTIQEFGKKFPKFDLNEFLIDFELGMSRENLSNKFEVGEMPMRSFVYSLGLDFVRSKRLASIEDFKYKLGLEDGTDHNVIVEMASSIETLASKNAKLYKSLTHARDENNALRKNDREEARVETWEQEFISEIVRECADIEVAPICVPDGNLIPTKTRPFILLSDMHWSEYIEGEYIENINEFNMDICREGMDKHFAPALSMTGEECFVFNAGDLISGAIHGLDLTGEVPVTQSVVLLAVELTSRYKALAQNYDKVYIKMIVGNHSRLTYKPSTRHKAFDYEHLLFELVQQMCSDTKNIEMEFSKSTLMVVNLAKKSFEPKYVGLTHGDSYKVMGDSALLKTITMFEQTFGVKATHVMSGHTHKMSINNTPNGGFNIVNGCYSGSSMYGISTGFNPLSTYQITGLLDDEGNIVSITPVNVR